MTKVSAKQRALLTAVAQGRLYVAETTSIWWQEANGGRKPVDYALVAGLLTADWIRLQTTTRAAGRRRAVLTKTGREALDRPAKTR